MVRCYIPPHRPAAPEVKKSQKREARVKARLGKYDGTYARYLIEELIKVTAWPPAALDILDDAILDRLKDPPSEDKHIVSALQAELRR